MTNFFFERYRPEICRGLHKWCCKWILRRFRSFRAKKFFFENWKFFDFFAYPGSQISWKMTIYFYQIPTWNLSWTAQMVLRTNFKAFKVVSSEKKFFQKLEIFWLFLHIRGSQISWKMTNYFFARYRPEICRGLHKWCCERILRRLRLFREKKIFLTFLHIRGNRFLVKWTTSFLRDTCLKFVVDCTNGVANEF